MMRHFWCFLLLLVGAVALNGADRSAEVEHADTKQAELAGKTFVMQAARRILNRPEGTTVLELALANATPARKDQQQLQKVDPKAKDWGSITSRHPQSTNQPQEAPQKVAQTTPAELLKPYDHSSERVSKLALSFDGMDAYTTRYLVDYGQRFQHEPASPGVAAGHGFVLETAEGTLRVYDQESGLPLMPPISLNTFLGLPIELNRTDNVFLAGPTVAFPTCEFDEHTGRWFVAATTVDRDPITNEATAAYTDVAVSDNHDPTGSWKVYRILGANNGSGGTPDAQCDGGACVQVNPRMAVWDDAVVISTEEYALTNTSFCYGSNVYAIDKHALLRAADAATTALVRTWTGSAPASVSNINPARQAGACRLRNTFLMATPAARFQGDALNSLQLFSLTGTGTLSSRNPDVRLKWVEKEVRLGIEYSLPPPATQKPGINPYGIALGLPQSIIDSFGADMASVAFVNDRLYCTWGTALEVEGQTAAGVAWAVVDAMYTEKAEKDGLLGLGGGNSLIYPHLAVRDDGRGLLAVSVSGPDYYPSAAYAVFTDGQLGHLSLVAEGQAVIDGFSGYEFGVNLFGYKAAAVVDDTGAFWINSQYVAHPACTFEQWFLDPTCFGTRSSAANWGTRISKVRLFGRHY